MGVRRGAIVARALTEGDLSLKEAIQAFNELENAQHNNAWLFTKFVRQRFYNLATTGVTLNSLETAFDVAHTALTLNTDEVNPPPSNPWKDVRGAYVDEGPHKDSHVNQDLQIGDLEEVQ